jgi:D-inositol-3-phosphate glycosyltransferase
LRVRIGLVSLHTSPLDTPGRGDAGGMNVVVRALADELARAGHRVEVLTREIHERHRAPRKVHVLMRVIDGA